MPVWLLLKPLADLLPLELLVKAALVLAVAQIAGVDVVGFVQTQVLRSFIGI